MNFYLCSREKELQAALRQGYWPQASDPGLRAHVQECRDCQELVLVTEVLQKAKSEGQRAAPDTSSSLLWWRAQLRRRNEAIRRVSEPLAITAKISLLGMLVALCLGVWQWSRLADWDKLLQGFSGSSMSPFVELWTAVLRGGTWMAILVLVGLGALAAFTGFAVYLLREET